MMAESGQTGRGTHPAKEDLQRFMAGGLSREEARTIVRHLLRRCQVCTRETRRLWTLGDKRLRAKPIEATRQPRPKAAIRDAHRLGDPA